MNGSHDMTAKTIPQLLVHRTDCPLQRTPPSSSSRKILLPSHVRRPITMYVSRFSLQPMGQPADGCHQTGRHQTGRHQTRRSTVTVLHRLLTWFGVASSNVAVRDGEGEDLSVEFLLALHIPEELQASPHRNSHAVGIQSTVADSRKFWQSQVEDVPS